MNFELPHRRMNLLTGEWVLVSPHRAKRPWLGQVEKRSPEQLPQYDPGCYLCPGNERAGGVKNPHYTNTFVFDNDFMAILPPSGENTGREVRTSGDLFVAEAETGLCRVICFSPRHDLTLPELSQVQVEDVLHTWIEQVEEIGGKDFISYVQVFENKGAMMGCSNPHPHSQIWATGHVPVEPAKESRTQEQYLQKHGHCMLCDYLDAERKDGARLVVENEYFAALVPYWAFWPFEIMLIGKRHAPSLTDLTVSEISGLADLMRRITTKYDNLFEISFPYSMGFHQSPCDGKKYPEWHLHAHFYPPLLRSATVRKFMVGFEMLAMPQRDITPETAAERLRMMSEVHYKMR